ncbi:MAG: Alpha/Beta hydrolase protein [Lentinula lateritia]|uniref:Alpha/Beta hydrolase protein n=1 Tax=Lentinula lateritia TaxID=40482 RepID=A0ABQ8V0A3_9AGAR|nr:MAG: Alpha/Beta hydrolase protein [Lentinula lateritia]KAJ4467843.1 Alpha/Beta hydrolase protein [Lentinula lateritia]
MPVSSSTVEITEGFIPFSVPSLPEKPCQTHYKVIGTLDKNTTPLVALHGGPGTGHEYLLILADLGVPLILYDQIGCGKSTHYPEKIGDASFWTVELFLDELSTVLRYLGVQDNYNLAGHSWGGMLAANHAILQPKGLKRLILMSAPADMKLWAEAQDRLRKLLPQEVQDIMEKHEKEETTESEEYQRAMKAYYKRFLCTVWPLPDSILHSLGELEKDPTVYMTMNGPSEFHTTGSLKNWTVVEDAHKINVPTLLTNGRLDEAQDEVVVPFFEAIPRVKWVKFANSSHMPHFEERERYMKEMKSFLFLEY